MSACQWVAVEAWGLVNCTISVCMCVYRWCCPPVPPEQLFCFFFFSSIHWKHLPSKVMPLSVFKVHVFPKNILASNSLNQGVSQICIRWWGTQRVWLQIPFWLLLLAGAAGSPQPKLRSGLLFFVCTVETPLLVCWYWEFGKQPRAELWGGRAPSANPEKNFKCFFSKYQYSACPYTC